MLVIKSKPKVFALLHLIERVIFRANQCQIETSMKFVKLSKILLTSMGLNKVSRTLLHIVVEFQT